MLSEAAKQARRDYDKKYRETHREQIKENKRRYWERKAARIAAEKGGNESVPTEEA